MIDFDPRELYVPDLNLYKARVPIPFKIRDGQRLYKRSDLWRLRYRVQRYLSYLTMKELDQRNIDIFTNLTTLTEEGQIGLPPIEQDGRTSWVERWTHVMEEYGLRGTGMRAGFIKDVALPKPTAPIPAKGTVELKERGIDATGCLIKFGNQEWLEETWKTGRWRISPASYYQSDGLCAARKDSELELAVRIPCFVKHRNAGDYLDDEFPDSIDEIKLLHLRARTDYYLASFSRTFVHRLFDDFSADSCLIVVDEQSFSARMLSAFGKIAPTWFKAAEEVEYVDPVLPLHPPNVFVAKHFRYAYQREFRYILVPPLPEKKLPVITLNLGPLIDCCEFIKVGTNRHCPGVHSPPTSP